MGELLLVNHHTDNVSKCELTWRLFTELTVVDHPILHVCLSLIHRARILQVEHLLDWLLLLLLWVLNLDRIVALRGQEHRLRVVRVNEPTVIVVHVRHLNSIVVIICRNVREV